MTKARARVARRFAALGALALVALGARGLRTIIEQVLLDTMYDLPSLKSIRKVVIDESAITGEGKPYYIYEHAEQRRVASSD